MNTVKTNSAISFAVSSLIRWTQNRTLKLSLPDERSNRETRHSIDFYNVDFNMSFKAYYNISLYVSKYCNKTYTHDKVFLRRKS